LLAFHTYINEMHGSRSKIPSKKSRQAALRGGITSGVKGLNHVSELALCFAGFQVEKEMEEQQYVREGNGESS
jgi:hypothetical protein